MAECLQSYKPNPVLSCRAQEINTFKLTLPSGTRRTLAQLRSGKSPMLQQYLHKIDPTSHPSPLCPLCKLHDHNTKHLFHCRMIDTSLTHGDLWSNPVAVAELITAITPDQPDLLDLQAEHTQQHRSDKPDLHVSLMLFLS